MKGLRITQDVKKVKFGGVWGQMRIKKRFQRQ